MPTDLTPAAKVALMDRLARAINFIASDGYCVAEVILSDALKVVKPLSDERVAERRAASFPTKDAA